MTSYTPGDGGSLGPLRRESDVIVGYTIKEMFTQTQQAIGRIEGLMGSLSASLADKASHADLEALDARVLHFERAEAANSNLIEDYKATRAMVAAHETTLQRSDAARASHKATWALATGLLSGTASLVALGIRALGG